MNVYIVTITYKKSESDVGRRAEQAGLTPGPSTILRNGYSLEGVAERILENRSIDSVNIIELDNPGVNFTLVVEEQ